MEREYSAFISYRHADNKLEGRKWANWLHEGLEAYEIPPDLARVSKLPERFGQSLFPVFRDEEELPANANLSTPIVRALENSHFLIVLCSPRAVASRFVDEEIRCFKELGKGDRILGLILAGEPNASDPAKGARIEEECLPAALRFGKIGPHGEVDWEAQAEPLCADVRPDGQPLEGFTSAELFEASLAHLPKREAKLRALRYRSQLEVARLKIVAGILGVPLGVLTNRDLEARRRKFRSRMAIGVTVTALLTTAVTAAIIQRQATQRESARAARQQTDSSTSDQLQAAKLLGEGGRQEALPYLARALRHNPRNETAAASAALVLDAMTTEEVRSDTVCLIETDTNISTTWFTGDSKHLVGVLGSPGASRQTGPPARVCCWKLPSGELLAETPPLESWAEVVRLGDDGLLLTGNAINNAKGQPFHSVLRGWSLPRLAPVFEKTLSAPLSSFGGQVTSKHVVEVNQKAGELILREVQSGAETWKLSFADPQRPASSPRGQVIPRLRIGAISESAAKFAVEVDHGWSTPQPSTAQTQIRSLNDGALLATIPGNGLFDLSPCGRYGLSWVPNGGLTLWRLTDGSLIRHFPSGQTAGQGPVDSSTSFSPNGEYVGISLTGKELDIVRAADGERLTSHNCQAAIPGVGPNLSRASFAPDSKSFSFARVGEVVVTTTATQGALIRLKRNGVGRGYWSPDGTLFALPERRAIRILSAPGAVLPGRDSGVKHVGRLTSVRGVLPIRFSPSGRHLALLEEGESGISRSVRVVDATTMETAVTHDFFPETTLQFAWSSNGRWLACERQEPARRVNLSGKPAASQIVIYDLAASPVTSRVVETPGASFSSYEAALSDDGRRMATPDFAAKGIRIWDLDAPAASKSIAVETGELQSLRGFSDDGKRLWAEVSVPGPKRVTLEMSLEDGTHQLLERSPLPSPNLTQIPGGRWNIAPFGHEKRMVIDAQSKLPVGEPFPPGEDARIIASSPDGLSHVFVRGEITESNGHAVADYFLVRLPLLDLPATPPVWLPDLLELVAQSRIDTEGKSTRLSDAELSSLKETLRGVTTPDRFWGSTLRRIVPGSSPDDKGRLPQSR